MIHRSTKKQCVSLYVLTAGLYFESVSLGDKTSPIRRVCARRKFAGEFQERKSYILGGKGAWWICVSELEEPESTNLGAFFADVFALGGWIRRKINRKQLNQDCLSQLYSAEIPAYQKVSGGLDK